MYTRLCFGIASSPGVFQRIIDQLIHLDDILIPEQTMEKHNSNLRADLKRLRDAGLCLRSCSRKNFVSLFEALINLTVRVNT